MKIFYSWQSDLNNKYNWSFIETALKKAIKQISKEIEIDLNLDRDTKGIAGSPDITQTIFKKIEEASVFVGDITITNSKAIKYRKTSNPNVLIELGYAAGKLGWDRIICVCNVGYSNVEKIPFDLRARRIISYSCVDESNKLEQRELLEAILKSRIIEIIGSISSPEKSTTKPEDKEITLPILKLSLQGDFEIKSSSEELKVLLKEIKYRFENSEDPICIVEIIEEEFLLSTISKIQNKKSLTLSDREKIIDLKNIMKELEILKQATIDKLNILFKTKLYPISEQFEVLEKVFRKAIEILGYPNDLVFNTTISDYFDIKKKEKTFIKKGTKFDVFPMKNRNIGCSVYLTETEIKEIADKLSIKEKFLYHPMPFKLSNLSEDKIKNDVFPSFIHEMQFYYKIDEISLEDELSWAYLWKYGVSIG